MTKRELMAIIKPHKGAITYYSSDIRGCIIECPEVNMAGIIEALVNKVYRLSISKFRGDLKAAELAEKGHVEIYVYRRKRKNTLR